MNRILYPSQRGRKRNAKSWDGKAVRLQGRREGKERISRRR
ncbi:MAG: hypothetical protein ACLU5E_08965 [Anaerovoracaceae bacterium]